MHYCGADADQVDHVIPISKAPELVMSFDNAVACCKRCNVQKGNKSQGVFLATLKKYCTQMVMRP
jgi:5-methylcytosine-specific restriction endonuclease McrA